MPRKRKAAEMESEEPDVEDEQETESGLPALLLNTPLAWLIQLPKFMDSPTRNAYFQSHKEAWNAVMSTSRNAKLTLQKIDDTDATVQHMLEVLTTRAQHHQQEGPEDVRHTTLAFRVASPMTHPLIARLKEDSSDVLITGLDVQTADASLLNEALLARPENREKPDDPKGHVFPRLQSLAMDSAPVPLPAFDKVPPGMRRLEVRSGAQTNLPNIAPWLPHLVSLSIKWSGNFYAAQHPSGLQHNFLLLLGKVINPDWRTQRSYEYPDPDENGHPRFLSVYRTDIPKMDRLEELELPTADLTDILIRTCCERMPRLQHLSAKAMPSLSRAAGEDAKGLKAWWPLRRLTLLSGDTSLKKMYDKLQCMPEHPDGTKLSVCVPLNQLLLDLTDFGDVEYLHSKYILRVVDSEGQPTACITSLGHFAHLTNHINVIDTIKPPPRTLSITNPVNLSSSDLIALKKLDRRTLISNLTATWQLKVFSESLPTINGVTRLTLDCDLTDVIISVLNHSFPNVTELFVPGVSISTDYRKAGIMWGIRRLTVTHRAAHLTHLAALPENMHEETVHLRVPTLVCMIGNEKVVQSVLDRLSNVTLVSNKDPVLVPRPSQTKDDRQETFATTLRLLEGSSVLESGKSSWAYIDDADVSMPHVCATEEPLFRLTKLDSRTTEARVTSDAEIEAFDDRVTHLLAGLDPLPILYVNDKVQLSRPVLEALAASQHYDSIDGEWKVGLHLPSTNMPRVRGVKQLTLSNVLSDELLSAVHVAFPDLEQLTVPSTSLRRGLRAYKWLVGRLNVLHQSLDLEAAVLFPRHLVEGCKTVVSSPELVVKEFSQQQAALLREPLSHLAFPPDTLLTFKDITEKKKPEALASTLRLLHSAGHKTAFVIEHQGAVVRQPRQSGAAAGAGSHDGAGAGSQAGVNSKPMIRLAWHGEDKVLCSNFIGKDCLDPKGCAKILGGLSQVVLINHRVLLSAGGIQALARMDRANPFLTSINADWVLEASCAETRLALPAVRGVQQLQLRQELDDRMLLLLQQCFPDLEQLTAPGLNLLLEQHQGTTWGVKRLIVSKEAVALTHVTHLPQLGGEGVEEGVRTQVILPDIACELPTEDPFEDNPEELATALGRFSLLRSGSSHLVPHYEVLGTMNECRALQYMAQVIEKNKGLGTMGTELSGWTLDRDLVPVLSSLTGGGTLTFTHCKWPESKEFYARLLDHVPKDCTFLKLGVSGQGLRATIMAGVKSNPEVKVAQIDQDMIAIKRPAEEKKARAAAEQAATAQGAVAEVHVEVQAASGVKGGAASGAMSVLAMAEGQQSGAMECD